MLYKFIRTGKNLTEQVDNQDVIQDCFAACSPKVKAQLSSFFGSNQSGIRFDFDDCVITIEIYQPPKTGA